MYLLDTNVVSEIRRARSGRANSGVIEWADATPSPLTFLSVISLHELELGVLLAERADPPAGAVLRSWLGDSLVPAFADRLLPVDHAVALVAASLHVPDPAPYRDAFIGATALVHGLTVVTRNVADFTRFAGLAVHDPFR